MGERVRHLNDEDLDALGVLLEVRIIEQLDHNAERLHERLDLIMATLQEVLDADAQVGDEINQVIALLQEDTALIAQLQGQIGSGNLPPEQQANVDNLFTQLQAQRDQINAALNPNIPTPAPAPAPPVVTPDAPVNG